MDPFFIGFGEVVRDAIKNSLIGSGVTPLFLQKGLACKDTFFSSYCEALHRIKKKDLGKRGICGVAGRGLVGQNSVNLGRLDPIFATNDLPMAASPILTIRDLTVHGGGKTILHQLNLTIGHGELHGLIGPNGAGKSTLGYFLAGKPEHEHGGGSVSFFGEDLLGKKPEERAQQGLFLAFQQPIAIPGVQNFHFLQAAINGQRKLRGAPPLKIKDALVLMKSAIQRVGLGVEFLHRSLNDGFSGGEQKRNELLQMILLQPKLAILDEIDSGLDLEARKLLLEIIRSERKKGVSFLMITHYVDLLRDLKPDHVHIMKQGRLVLSGGSELANQALSKGYENLG